VRSIAKQVGIVDQRALNVATAKAFRLVKIAANTARPTKSNVCLVCPFWGCVLVGARVCF